MADEELRADPEHIGFRAPESKLNRIEQGMLIPVVVVCVGGEEGRRTAALGRDGAAYGGVEEKDNSQKHALIYAPRGPVTFGRALPSRRAR